jgi:hypothetical protein
LHRKSIDEHLPELRPDIVVPEQIAAAPFLLTSLWMGPSGSITPIHHDFTNNLFVQVQGRKKVILYPPDPDAAFYRLPFKSHDGRSSWHISRVGSFNTADYERYPLFREAKPLEVVVDAGSILFIPNFYWHEVHSLDSPSISLSYWWDARTAAEIESSIAKITDLLQLLEGTPVEWRGLVERLITTQTRHEQTARAE